MKSTRPGKVLALLGPTASGKSRLAMELAQAFPVEILNCDSRQIYQEMNIGTAKPSEADRQAVAHHLLDLVAPDERFSGGDWAAAAGECIRSLWRRRKIPLIVGGTGFFFAALREGLPGVEVPPRTRTRYQDLLDTEGLPTLIAALHDLDPTAGAHLDLHNSRRVLRALELVATAKRPLGEILADRVPFLADWATFVVTQPRHILHERIDQRTRQMHAAGLQDEVRTLVARYGEQAPGLNAIGYREWFPHLSGRLSEKEVLEAITTHTRQYAKRQETWFKKRPGERIRDLSLAEERAAIFHEVEQLVGRK